MGDFNESLFCFIKREQTIYCKGLEQLCEHMVEGFNPVAYSDSIQKLINLMADY